MKPQTNRTAGPCRPGAPEVPTPSRIGCIPTPRPRSQLANVEVPWLLRSLRDAIALTGRLERLATAPCDRCGAAKRDAIVRAALAIFAGGDVVSLRIFAGRRHGLGKPWLTQHESCFAQAYGRYISPGGNRPGVICWRAYLDAGEYSHVGS